MTIDILLKRSSTLNRNCSTLTLLKTVNSPVSRDYSCDLYSVQITGTFPWGTRCTYGAAQTNRCHGDIMSDSSPVNWSTVCFVALWVRRQINDTISLKGAGKSGEKYGERSSCGVGLGGRGLPLSLSPSPPSPFFLFSSADSPALPLYVPATQARYN